MVVVVVVQCVMVVVVVQHVVVVVVQCVVVVVVVQCVMVVVVVQCVVVFVVVQHVVVVVVVQCVVVVVVLPAAVDRLGDAKPQVRDQAAETLLKLMVPASHPQVREPGSTTTFEDGLFWIDTPTPLAIKVRE